MKWIIKKAEEIRERYGTDDLEELALKLNLEKERKLLKFLRSSSILNF